jgi:hypothetical protein
MTAPSQLVKRLKKALARRAVPHMYQRDGEIIAFARSDLAVSGKGLSSVAQVVDMRERAMSHSGLNATPRFARKGCDKPAFPPGQTAAFRNLSFCESSSPGRRMNWYTQTLQRRLVRVSKQSGNGSSKRNADPKTHSVCHGGILAGLNGIKVKISRAAVRCHLPLPRQWLLASPTNFGKCLIW